MEYIFKKIIIVLIIFGFLLPSFSLGEVPNIIEAPKTIDEVKKMAEETIVDTKRELPGILEQIWRNEVLPIWRNMWRWLNSKIQTIWQGIQERKSIIKEELKREKEEIKKGVSEISRLLWGKFKELIQ
jgi:hypothetical protein